MKITRYMGAFAVIAMLAACSTDDEQSANTAANEVKIAATVGGNSIFTRSNPLGTKAEQESFNENDAISVTTEGKTVVYTKNKDGQWANANDYLVWTGNAQTFEACYPGNSTNSISEGHIEADQSDITKIAQSDYMICRKEIEKKYIPADRQLALDFERQTARIIVKVSAFGNEFETRIPTLSAVEVYSKLKVPAGESDSYVGIQACKKDNVFYALVSPGTANSTEKFLKLTVTYNDGVGNPTQTKELYVTGIPALEKAKSYTYDVRIGKDNAIIGSVSVADWGTGDAITGGDASILTPELIIKQALAAGKTDITLNLAKDFNDFSEITDALKNAKERTIDLTLKGCESIEDFNSVESLKSINLPDVIAIYPQAFSDCRNLESVYAPNVMHIESFVFAGCSWLREVELGNISTAGFRIFDVVPTENVDLILSKDQKVMTGSDDEGWQSVESEPYARSDDHIRIRFLGKKFKSITCGNIKFE